MRDFFIDTANIESIKKIVGKLEDEINLNQIIGVTTNPNAFSKINEPNLGKWIETAQKISIINSSRLIENFIENVEITEFDKNFELLRTIFVEKVDISEVNWVMKRAKISINNKTTYSEYDLIYKTNFNSEKLNSYFSNLKSLSFFELYNAKRNYKKLGYSTNDLEIHLLKFYTYPFYLTIMTLFSCVIMMNIKHNKPKIFHIILGIMVSVIIYYITYFQIY